MGYFVDKYHGKCEEPLVKLKQNSNSEVDYVTYGMNMGLSIFGSLLTSHSDGHGGDSGANDEEKISKKTQKQINEIQGIIDTKLKEANASDLADISKNIAALQGENTKITGQIEKAELDIQSFQTVIDNYSSNKSALEKQFNEVPADKKSFVQAQINQLNQEKKNAENQIEALNTKKADLEKQLKEKEVQISQLQATYGEVENLEQNIENLKKQELPKEVSYDVNKEKDDLANFSKALKDFNANPTQENAAALHSAYKGGDDGVNNSSAKKAYELVAKRYPEFFGRFGYKL